MARPPPVEYELADLGATLTEPLAALGAWAHAHFDAVQLARDAYDDAR